MTFKRFSQENYAQTHIAWGLALIALGRDDEGKRHLDYFAQQTGNAENDPILIKAKRLAEEIAQAD